MRTSPTAMFAALLLVTPALAQTTTPATAPATTRVASIVPDLAGTFVVELWPNLTTTAPAGGETVTERVDPDGRRANGIADVARPSITAFLPTGDATPRAAVIVVPGGGYRFESIDREGYFVAQRLRDAGVAAFVLKYRLPNGAAPGPDEMPVPIADALRAIRLVRARAAEWRLDPGRVGIMGFSAGGHVAGTAATQFDAGDASSADKVQATSSRPDFAALVYPVASMDAALAHAGSRQRLLGDAPDAATVARFSTARHVDARTPPLFVIHARDDKGVRIENSEEIVAAARAAGVPCEWIELKTGGHGFGLGRAGTEPAGWIEKFIAWLPTAAATR